jgi:hypothetical protein
LIETGNSTDNSTHGWTIDVDETMEVIPEIKEHIQTKGLYISSKKELRYYLKNTFATMFFTPNRYVQQRLRIVGPVRLRTIHTKLKEKCDFKTQLDECYEVFMPEESQYKEPINGIEWQDCE